MDRATVLVVQANDVKVQSTRRALEDGATVEEIARRSAELKLQADALAEAFCSAPRSGTGLSLAEAAALAK